MSDKLKVILASGSPRRREILEQVGVVFEVRQSEVEEVTTQTESPEVVKELSHQKAWAVAAQCGEDVLVIGADTIVACGDTILGKPRDDAHAKEMLRQLQGNSHHVYTGVTLVLKRNGQTESISFAEDTMVSIAPMDDAQMDAYLATGEHWDKAGAYAVQGRFAIYVQGLEGDYYNVVGLPVSRLYRECLKMGINLLAK